MKTNEELMGCLNTLITDYKEAKILGSNCDNFLPMYVYTLPGRVDLDDLIYFLTNLYNHICFTEGYERGYDEGYEDSQEEFFHEK